MKLKSFKKHDILAFTIWMLAAAFFLYEFFLRTFVGTVAHQIIPALHLNAETFALIGSAYYITYAIMQVPVGILTDRFGVKKIMIFATLVCAGSTFLFTHSSGFLSAFLSRLLMGFGSSFAFVCLLVVVSTWFSKKKFGFLAGISQFIGTMGPFLAGGPLVSALARSHTSWRNLLSFIGAFGILLAVLIFFIVKNKPRNGAQSLVYLKQGQHSFTGSIRKLMQNKQAWTIAGYSACVYGSAALLGAIWGTAYLEAKGLTQAFSADMISVVWLGYAIGCPLVGFISDVSKRRKPTLLACAIIGLFISTLIVDAPISRHWIYVLLFFGIGISAAGQNVGFAIITEHVDQSTRAAALGLNNAAITSFGAIIPLVASYFINFAAHGDMKHLIPSDFTIGLTIMPVMYLISFLLVTLFIKETFCKPQKEVLMLKKNFLSISNPQKL